MADRKISHEVARKMKGEADGMLDDAMTAFRERYADDHLENVAFYRGWQSYMTDADYQYGAGVIDEDEAAEVQNMIRPLVRAATSTMLRNMPNPEVAAISSDDKSRARAEATQRLTKAWSRNGVLSWDALHRTVSWSKQTGLAFMKVAWDPRLGKAIDTGVTGFEDEQEGGELDELGEEANEIEFEGEIATQFVSSTDGLPDPSARSWDEVQHFFHVRLLPVSYLQDRYPVDFYGKPSKGWDTGGRSGGEQSRYQYLQMNDIGFGSSSEANAASKAGHLAQLNEMWEMPSRRFPKGRLIIFSGDVLIYVGPNLFWPVKARIPFIPFFGDNIVPGSLYPDGMIQDIKPIQKTINRTASKMREHLDRVLNSHVLVPNGSGIDVNTWGDKPGQIIRHSKGYKPEFLRPPEMPVSTFNYINDLRDVGSAISGYGDITRGQLPSSDLSGRAISFITENEQVQREPEIVSFRQSVTKVLQQCVWTAKQFYQDGKLLKLIGDDGGWVLEQFKSDDYDLDNELILEPYSGAPVSRAMRYSETLEMYNAGLLGDDPAAQRARAMLGDDTLNKSTFDPFHQDRLVARKEQLQFLNDPNYLPEAHSWEHHPTHIEEHNKFRNTEEFKKLPKAHQDAFSWHVEYEHEQWLAAQEEEFADMQGMLGPGGAPAAAAPAAMPSPMDGGAATYPGEEPSIESGLPTAEIAAEEQF